LHGKQSVPYDHHHNNPLELKNNKVFKKNKSLLSTARQPVLNAWMYVSGVQSP